MDAGAVFGGSICQSVSLSLKRGAINYSLFVKFSVTCVIQFICSGVVLTVYQIRRPYFHVKPLEKSQLKNWRDYLAFEIANGSEKRVTVLFERCVIACALYEEFWMKVCVNSCASLMLLIFLGFRWIIMLIYWTVYIIVMMLNCVVYVFKTRVAGISSWLGTVLVAFFSSEVGISWRTTKCNCPVCMLSFHCLLIVSCIFHSLPFCC